MARDGLKAPLPEDWKPCQNSKGKIYYFNFKTKQSQWEHPCDQYYKKLYLELKRNRNEKKQVIADSPNSILISKKEDILPSVKFNRSSNSLMQNLNESFGENILSISTSTIMMAHETSGKPVPLKQNEFENFETLGRPEKEKNKKSELINELNQKGQSKINMENEREEFKTNDVINLPSNSHVLFLEEKENLKSNLNVLYQRKSEEKQKVLKKEYESKLKESFLKESKRTTTELRKEEEELIELYEIKIEVNKLYCFIMYSVKNLNQHKEKVIFQKNQLKFHQGLIGKNIEKVIELEKEKIYAEYKQKLKEVEMQEKVNNENQILKRKQEFTQKLNEEQLVRVK